MSTGCKIEHIRKNHAQPEPAQSIVPEHCHSFSYLERKLRQQRRGNGIGCGGIDITNDGNKQDKQTTT